MQYVARKLLFFCCILTLCLTGCAANQSTVRGVQLNERETKIAALGNYTVGILDFFLTTRCAGVSLTARSLEIW